MLSLSVRLPLWIMVTVRSGLRLWFLAFYDVCMAMLRVVVDVDATR